MVSIIIIAVLFLHTAAQWLSAVGARRALNTLVVDLEDCCLCLRDVSGQNSCRFQTAKSVVSSPAETDRKRGCLSLSLFQLCRVIKSTPCVMFRRRAVWDDKSDVMVPAFSDTFSVSVNKTFLTLISEIRWNNSPLLKTYQERNLKHRGWFYKVNK